MLPIDPLPPVIPSDLNPVLYGIAAGIARMFPVVAAAHPASLTAGASGKGRAGNEASTEGPTPL